MLYQFYRYIIGLSAIFVIGIAALLIVFFSDPNGFSAIGQTQTFGPILQLLNIFTVFLVISTLIFTHPFVTDGYETLHMSGPLSHASVQGNMILLIAVGVLKISATEAHIMFFTKQVVDAASFYTKIGLVSLATSILGFYAVRYRARYQRKAGRQQSAFCFETSFGLK